MAFNHYAKIKRILAEQPEGSGLLGVSTNQLEQKTLKAKPFILRTITEFMEATASQ